MTTQLRRGRPAGPGLPPAIRRLADRAAGGLPRAALDPRGVALAAVVEGFAAVVWFGWAQAGAGGWFSTLLLLGALVAFAVAVAGFLRAARARRSGSPLRNASLRRRYVTILSVEALALVLGLVVLALSRTLGWSPVWFGILFGLHAVPLGRVLGDPALEVAGLVVVAVSVVAFLVGLTGLVSVAALTGTGAGLTLLVAGIASVVPRSGSRSAGGRVTMS